MKQTKKEQLAKVAYLYYVKHMSQEEISKALSIYRTTVSRMLTQARSEGIVQIKIALFNSELFELEEIFKKTYGLKSVVIVASEPDDSEVDKEEKLATIASQWLRNHINDGDFVGLSWGASIGQAVAKIESKRLEEATFIPIVGGPSYINSKYHINTLVYEMARKFQGNSIFVNATVVQESKELAEGIFNSKYFEEIKYYWEKLDMVIVGVGGVLSYRKSQWRDLITEADLEDLKLREAIGDCCCRFFDQEGKVLKGELDRRTIGFPLENLIKVKRSVAIARGKVKARAIRALLKRGYINSLITDQETLLAILKLDNVDAK